MKALLVMLRRNLTSFDAKQRIALMYQNISFFKIIIFLDTKSEDSILCCDDLTDGKLKTYSLNAGNENMNPELLSFFQIFLGPFVFLQKF